MQKALHEMNLLLPKVISDITGKTGMAIIKAILAGRRDPRELAELRDYRIRKNEAVIAKALQGDYRSEQLFLLRKALEQYEYLTARPSDYDREIYERLERFPKKVEIDPRERLENSRVQSREARRNRNTPRFDTLTLTHRYCYPGNFYWRIRARHGAAKALTATARKIAVLYYRILRKGRPYCEPDRTAYLEKIQQQRIANLKKRAAKLGFELVANAS